LIGNGPGARAAVRWMRLAAIALPAVGLLAGCTFPEVTFGPAEPDGGLGTEPVLDAGTDDVTIDDAQAPSDSASAAETTVGDGTPDGGCDFDGTWGSRITIDVSWTPQGLTGIILAPGTGQIRQWIRGRRIQGGAGRTALSDTSVVCSIELPDFKETTIAGGETYGVSFPDTLFDNGYLPTFIVNGALNGASPLSPGGTYSTTTTAALLGLTMANPTTDPWPATIVTAIDMDQDGKPGVTVGASQGPGYSEIPTEIPGAFQQPARATAVYLAIRQVTVVTATVTDCDHMVGTVEIPQIQTSPGNSKYAIDSHVLGCALADGGDCTTSTPSQPGSQAAFVDNSQPVFTPSGMTEFRSVRLAANATCADVRSALP
jgi:hypothetical protein